MAAQLVPATTRTEALQALHASINATCPTTFGDAGGRLNSVAWLGHGMCSGLEAKLHCLQPAIVLRCKRMILTAQGPSVLAELPTDDAA